MADSERELLLKNLRNDADVLARAVERLSDEQLEQGRYEDGWNVREILAHIAAIEWTYPRLLQLASQRALVDYEQMVARLEQLVGISLGHLRTWEEQK